MQIASIFSVGLIALGPLINPVPTSEIAVKKLRGATMHISVGTGFLMEGAKGTYLMTNWHVCLAGAWQGKIQGNYEDGELLRGKIVKFSPRFDLCVAKVGRAKAPFKKPLKLSKSLKPGQAVYTRGYPFMILSETSGHVIGEMQWDYTFPIEEIGQCYKGSKKEYNTLGALTGCTFTFDDNVTDMYARPGSSGSPVVDANGDLVGVMSSWDSGADAGGMVKLEHITEFMKGL